MEPRDARRTLLEWQAQHSEAMDRSEDLAKRAAAMREAAGGFPVSEEGLGMLLDRIDLLQKGQDLAHQRYLDLSMVLVDVIERINDLGDEPDGS